MERCNNESECILQTTLHSAVPMFLKEMAKFFENLKKEGKKKKEESLQEMQDSGFRIEDL